MATTTCIEVPISMIRSPGSLLNTISAKLLSKALTSVESSPPTTANTFSRSSTASFNSSGHVISNSSFPDFNTNVAPKQILTPTQILKSYNVELSSNLYHGQTLAALTYISEELEKLPQGFVQKLQLKIVLSDVIKNYDPKYVISTKDCKEKTKVLDKFQGMIFDSVLIKFNKLPRVWSEYMTEVYLAKENERKKNPSDEVKLSKLEVTFSAIMFNKKHPKNKLYINKLKELLISVDPTSFSMDWFKIRNRELKKELKVCFTTHR